MRFLLIFLLLLATGTLHSQDLGSMPQGIQQSVMKASLGWQEYTPITPQSSLFEGSQVSLIPNFLGAKIPGLENTQGAIGFVQKAFQGKFCPDGSYKQVEYHLWIFKLNDANILNTFATSPRDKSGMVRLNGTMEKYIPGGNYCNTGEMTKVDSGPYTLNVNFKTFVHTTPRNFQIMGKGEGTEDMFKNFRQLKQLYKNQLLPYLQYVEDYKSKPHITRIGGNGVADNVTIDTRQPVKAGTEDADAGWKATRDGMGFLKNSLEAIAKAADFGQAVHTAAQVLGSGRKIGVKAAQAVLGLVQSAANVVGVDLNFPSVQAEASLNATVDMMLRATAEAMKQYAPQDPAAREINERSKVDVDSQQDYKPMIDASLMISALNDAFDQLDNLEQEFEDAGLQNDIVEGTLIGPGIYERLEMSFGALPMAGASTALQEQGLDNMPQMLQNFENMGYAIPDEIKNIDIQAKLAEAQAKLNSKGFDLDIKKPNLYFMSHTTSRIYFEGREAPNVWIYFQISSPDEYVDTGFINDATIFGGDTQPNDGQEPNETEKVVIWVAPNGNDANVNSHSFEEPLATLQKALEIAHSKRQERNPVEIIMKDGIYEQNATVDWSGSQPQDLAPLSIVSENVHGAIIKGTLPIEDDVVFVKGIRKDNNWNAPLPLHPNQPTYNPGGNPIENPPPVVKINGQHLIHVPQIPNVAKGLYTLGSTMVTVAPPEGVANPNEATVEVGIYPYALKIKGGGTIAVRNVKLSGYPLANANGTPGVVHDGNVQVMNCKFE